MPPCRPPTTAAGGCCIAGDAAHIHPPTGGQGIGLGVQDAVNLGWKLAQVVQGVSPEALLDTYVAERHPATARVLRNVMTQAFLQKRRRRTEAVRDDLRRACCARRSRRDQVAGLLSGLDVALDLGEGHPLLGRRMPDLDLITADGPRRVFELLHDARPCCSTSASPAAPSTLAPWADRVRRVDAEPPRHLGAARRRGRSLPRPPCWSGPTATWPGSARGTAAGLPEALTTWFGPARELSDRSGSGGVGRRGRPGCRSGRPRPVPGSVGAAGAPGRSSVESHSSWYAVRPGTAGSVTLPGVGGAVQDDQHRGRGRSRRR